jgi:hypothetical protein
MAEPGGPPETPAGAEARLRDLVLLQTQAHVPRQLETHVQPDPVDQLAQARTAWQEILVIGKRQRPERQTELVLPIPHPAAGDGGHAEHRAIASEIRSLRDVERHPVPDELFDLHRYAKEMLEDRAQAFRVACMTDQRADVEELGQVGNGIARAKRRRGDAEERAEIAGKAIVVRPIAIDMRLRLRPCPVEQRQEPVMEEVEEARQRPVPRLPQAVARVFRDVDRQRAVRTEQAEQVDVQPRRTAAAARLERGQRRRRERQIRILAETHRLVGRPPGVAPARLRVVHALETPQRLVEVVAVGCVRQRREERQSVGLAPHCGTHRLISPRPSVRSAVSVNELIET